MNVSLAAVVAVTIIGIGSTASAQGDATRGQQKAVPCGACHGSDGNSVVPEWPKLAGMDGPYLVAQLRAFQTGQRSDVLMTLQAKGLTEQDLQDLAAFYASRKMTTNATTEADKKLFEQGERIFKAGVAGKTVTACMVCHGPAGAGHPAAGFTRLAGQHAAYVEAQLKAFRSKTRTDAERIMSDVSVQMTDEEIRAVASYISTLPAQP